MVVELALQVRVLVERREKYGWSKGKWMEWNEGKDLWETGKPLGLTFLQSERVLEIEVRKSRA